MLYSIYFMFGVVTKKKNQHLNRGFSVSAYGVLVAAEMLISLQL